MTQNRRKFRLYAPFEQRTTEAGKTRYIRLTYTVTNPDGTRVEKTFPGSTLDTARRRYQDLLIWGIWGSRQYRDPQDGRRHASISLRPVPKAEQPELV
jgi:hypothetical protein